MLDHYHRATFTEPGMANGTDPDGPAQWLRYDQQAESYERPPSALWRWDFDADLAWVAAGFLPQGPYTAEELAGDFALKTVTDIGAVDVGLKTGIQGAHLSQTHYLGTDGDGYRPVPVPACYACVVGPSVSELDGTGAGAAGGGLPSPRPPSAELGARTDTAPLLFWQHALTVAPGGFMRAEREPAETDVLLPWAGHTIALGPAGDCGAQLADEAVGPVLAAQLGRTDLRWLRRAEALVGQGAGASFPLAVALSETGDELFDTVVSDGQRLLSAGDRMLDLAPREGSPWAYGWAGVLSAVRRGVFVVGGRRPGSGEPAGEVWFTPLEGSGWSEIPSDPRPEYVLAATYGFASDELFILDETPEGEARLFAVGVATGASRVLWSSPRQPEWDRQWLAIDRDGLLLLASSDSAGQRYALARIDARDPAAPATLAGIERGVGRLLLPPVADGSGYSLVRAGAAWPEEALVASDEVRLEKDAVLEGAVAVLEAGGLVDLDKASVAGRVRADRVVLDKGASIGGDAAFNSLVTKKGSTVLGSRTTPLALPLALALPPWPELAPGAGEHQDVDVAPGSRLRLAPGSYGELELEGAEPASAEHDGGNHGYNDGDTGHASAGAAVVELAGGTYRFERIELGRRARLECSAVCDVRVLGRLEAEEQSYLGPARAKRSAAFLTLHVEGGNFAPAADLGAGSEFHARLFARDGKVVLGAGSTGTGAILARVVRLREGASFGADARAVLFDRRASLLYEEAQLAEVGGIL